MARSGPGGPSINPSAVGFPPWLHLLKHKADGGPRPLLLNGQIAVENDPLFAYAIMLNVFSQEITMLKPMPWDPNALLPRPWKDTDDIRLAQWLQDNDIMLSPNQAAEIVLAFATDHPFHPVVDYFNRLTWDGIPRLGDANTPSWLTFYCGAKDSDYVRAVGSRWMISGIARIFEPGCQVDSVLILEGRTGLGKSSVFRTLGAPWYTNRIASLSSDEASEQIIGKHIIELDELDAMQRAGEWAAVLSFITTPIDHFRLKYGRRSGDFPRQCIFGGTTEKSEWLRDHAGHRRWWPIACGPAIDLVTLANDKDQLWAEAVTRYQNNERHWLHEIKLIGQAAAETADRIESDLWEDKVQDYLSGKRSISLTRVLEWGIGIPLDRQTDREKRRAARILKKLKWVRRTTDPMTGKPENIWVPEPPDPQLDLC